VPWIIVEFNIRASVLNLVPYPCVHSKYHHMFSCMIEVMDEDKV